LGNSREPPVQHVSWYQPRCQESCEVFMPRTKVAPLQASFPFSALPALSALSAFLEGVSVTNDR
jgi:hypothetical protein